MLEDGGGRTVSQEGSGFQEPRLELKGGGSYVGRKRGAVHTVFPALLFRTELLSEIWKW